MATKITKKQNFTTIMELLQELGKEELAQVMAHEIELLDKKKASGKLTKNQEVNEGIKELILNALKQEEQGITITDLLNKYEDVANATNKSNQKTSALLKQLKDSGTVERVQDGKKALFKIA